MERTLRTTIGALVTILLMSGCRAADVMQRSAGADFQLPPDGVSATVTTVGRTFYADHVVIRQGGTVSWAFAGTHTVTFTGEAPDEGSIPATAAGVAVTRTFSTPGDYAYFCSRHAGMGGSVTVLPADGRLPADSTVDR